MRRPRTARPLVTEALFPCEPGHRHEFLRVRGGFSSPLRFLCVMLASGAETMICSSPPKPRFPSRRRTPQPRVTVAFAAFVPAFFLICCSAKTPGADSTADASPGAAALGKATFSALIDGEPVSGGAIDDMQQQNAAYTIPSSHGGPPNLLFYLFDAKVPNDPHFSHSFRLYLPKKLGTASKAYLALNIILDPSHAACFQDGSIGHRGQVRYPNGDFQVDAAIAVQVTNVFRG